MGSSLWDLQNHVPLATGEGAFLMGMGTVKVLPLPQQELLALKSGSLTGTSHLRMVCSMWATDRAMPLRAHA